MFNVIYGVQMKRVMFFCSLICCIATSGWTSGDLRYGLMMPTEDGESFRKKTALQSLNLLDKDGSLTEEGEEFLKERAGISNKKRFETCRIRWEDKGQKKVEKLLKFPGLYEDYEELLETRRIFQKKNVCGARALGTTGAVCMAIAIFTVLFAVWEDEAHTTWIAPKTANIAAACLVGTWGLLSLTRLCFCNHDTQVR